MVADRVATSLVNHAAGPYYFTPDGLQAPLLDRLADLTTMATVVREDIAVAMAAGACLAGATPVVLMQNSGLGNTVNALASLAIPYQLGMLLVIGVRGIDDDATEENRVMGRATERLLGLLGIPARYCTAARVDEDIGALATLVRAGRPAALLIRPGLFGWKAAR